MQTKRYLFILPALLTAVMFFSASCNPQKSAKGKKEEAQLHYQFAQNHFNQGDYLSALKELMLSDELDKSDPDTQYLLGTTYYLLNKYNEAETHLLSSIKLNPGNPDAYNNLGNVYIAMGRWDEAIANFERCLGFILYQNNFPTIYTNIGIACSKKGDFAKAEENYKNAIKINNKFCPAHLNLGDLYSKMKKPELSIISYDKVISSCPDTNFALLAKLYKGIELSTQGNTSEACALFYEVAKKKPDSESADKAEQYIRLLKCR